MALFILIPLLFILFVVLIFNGNQKHEGNYNRNGEDNLSQSARSIDRTFKAESFPKPNREQGAVYSQLEDEIRKPTKGYTVEPPKKVVFELETEKTEEPNHLEGHIQTGDRFKVMDDRVAGQGDVFEITRRHLCEEAGNSWSMFECLSNGNRYFLEIHQFIAYFTLGTVRLEQLGLSEFDVTSKSKMDWVEFNGRTFDFNRKGELLVLEDGDASKKKVQQYFEFRHSDEYITIKLSDREVNVFVSVGLEVTSINWL